MKRVLMGIGIIILILVLMSVLVAFANVSPVVAGIVWVISIPCTIVALFVTKNK